jgi:hypothetical protein
VKPLKFSFLGSNNAAGGWLLEENDSIQFRSLCEVLLVFFALSARKSQKNVDHRCACWTGILTSTGSPSAWIAVAEYSITSFWNVYGDRLPHISLESQPTNCGTVFSSYKTRQFFRSLRKNITM